MRKFAVRMLPRRAVHVASALLALALVACGDGGGATTPSPPSPPPPPPPAPVAAAIELTAGGGQSGEPGDVLPTRVEFTVRTAAGAPVSGVTVTFRVDSGGGTLEFATAVSNPQGVVSPGTWRLGSAVGRHVMSASVPGLGVAVVAATAVIVPRTVADTSLTSGRITITTGPLRGFSLEIPAGAYSRAARWTIEQRTPRATNRDAWFYPVGPVVRISRLDDERPREPLTLTLPARIDSGFRPLVFLRDPVTGNTEAIPAAAEAGTVQTAAVHLDGARIAGRASTPALRTLMQSASATTPAFVDIEVSSVPVSELDKDVDTGFRPGVDQLGIPNIPTRYQLAPMELGMLVSEVIYFSKMKGRNGPLWRAHEEIEGGAITNRRAFQASGYVASKPDIGPDALFVGIRAIRRALRAGAADQAFLDVIKANLLGTTLPQLVVAHSPGFINGHPLLVYRTTGKSLHLASPTKQGDGNLQVTFDAGRFSPFTDPVDGATLPELGSIGLSTVITTATSTDVESIFADRPNADATAYLNSPPRTLVARTGFVDGDDFYVVDTARLWVECPLCETGMTSTLSRNRLAGLALYVPNESGSYSLSGRGFEMGYKWDRAGSYDMRVGVLMLETEGASKGDKWLDWKWIRVKRWEITLAPNLSAAAGSPVTLKADVKGPTTPSVRYQFIVGSGPSAVTVTSPLPEATLTVNDVGTQPVRVEMRRTSDNKVIGIGSGSLGVYDIPPTWRMTAITVTREMNGPAPVGTGTSIQGFWNSWTTFLENITSGRRQGGLMFIDRDRTFGTSGTALETGLYVVSADTLTPAAIATRLRVSIKNGFALLSPDPIGNWLISRLTTSRTTDDATLNEFYQGPSTLTQGTIRGSFWQLTDTYTPTVNTQLHFPQTVRMANVTFNGDVATGTLTFVARETRRVVAMQGQSITYPEVARHTIRVSFTATRVRE